MLHEENSKLMKDITLLEKIVSDGNVEKEAAFEGMERKLKDSTIKLR